MIEAAVVLMPAEFTRIRAAVNAYANREGSGPRRGTGGFLPRSLNAPRPRASVRTRYWQLSGPTLTSSEIPDRDMLDRYADGEVATESIRKESSDRRVGNGTADVSAGSECARRDSNPQPSDTFSASLAVRQHPLSSCAAIDYADTHPQPSGQIRADSRAFVSGKWRLLSISQPADQLVVACFLSHHEKGTH
jgi:hypothetical protein